MSISGLNIRNNKLYKHTLYTGHDQCTEKIFSQKTINNISKKITDSLKNLIPSKKIIVTDKVISSVLSNIEQNFKPKQMGDIHTRYIIKKDYQKCKYDDIIDQTINFIVEDVKNQFIIRINNSKLSKWNTILGNHNEKGLTSSSKIKLRIKRPSPFQFHMNY